MGAKKGQYVRCGLKSVGLTTAVYISKQPDLMGFRI